MSRQLIFAIMFLAILAGGIAAIFALPATRLFSIVALAMLVLAFLAPPVREQGR